MDYLEVLSRLLSLLLLIAINAFFVTAEFSIVSVRRSRISQLVASGDVQAQTVQSLQRGIERLLSTTQLGITLSSLALGWLGEETMADLVKDGIAILPLSVELKMTLAHSISVPISFILIAYLQIVLGELCPKSLALSYSEQIARFLATPSLVISRVFNPFIWILNQSTRCLLKLVGAEFTGQEWYKSLPAEELRLMIATDKELSGLEKEERELLNNVFEFSDVVAVEVMTPRTKITSLPKSATFEELLNQVAITGHFCFPIIGESLDNILGIIDFKELALPLAQGLLSAETPLENWVKPARFVPEGIFLSELLSIMQRSHQKMAIVVDEFGGTSGLVTIQDLIAEIIGEEKHQQIAQKALLEVIDQDTFIVQADLYIEQVNEFLNIDLEISDEYQTLAGFISYQMQRIPSIGEKINYKNLEFTVVSAAGPKLKQIKVYRQDLPDNENEE